MKRKKIIFILTPIVLLILYRFSMTLAFIGTGIYKDSPYESMTAWVMGYSTEFFFGGENDFSVFEIHDKNNQKILRHKYQHPGRHFEWYQKGEIIWESSNKIKFVSDSKTILFLYL